MLSILSRRSNASNVKEFVLEMDNYYDVQRAKRNKVFKTINNFIDHAL